MNTFFQNLNIKHSDNFMSLIYEKLKSNPNSSIDKLYTEELEKMKQKSLNSLKFKWGITYSLEELEDIIFDAFNKWIITFNREKKSTAKIPEFHWFNVCIRQCKYNYWQRTNKVIEFEEQYNDDGSPILDKDDKQKKIARRVQFVTYKEDSFDDKNDLNYEPHYSNTFLGNDKNRNKEDISYSSYSYDRFNLDNEFLEIYNGVEDVSLKFIQSYKVITGSLYFDPPSTLPIKSRHNIDYLLLNQNSSSLLRIHSLITESRLSSD